MSLAQPVTLEPQVRTPRIGTRQSAAPIVLNGRGSLEVVLTDAAWRRSTRSLLERHVGNTIVERDGTRLSDDPEGDERHVVKIKRLIGCRGSELSESADRPLSQWCRASLANQKLPGR